MIDTKSIQKIVRTALRRSRGLEDHHLMHPTREWFSGLAVALVLLVSGAAWCAYLYWDYNTIEADTSTSSDTPVTIYQKAAVDSALQELEARANRLAEEKRILESNRISPPPQIVDVQETPSPESATPENTATPTPEDTSSAAPVMDF